MKIGAVNTALSLNKTSSIYAVSALKKANNIVKDNAQQLLDSIALPKPLSAKHIDIRV